MLLVFLPGSFRNGSGRARHERDGDDEAKADDDSVQDEKLPPDGEAATPSKPAREAGVSCLPHSDGDDDDDERAVAMMINY